MAAGFWVAGELLIKQNKRAIAVSPRKQTDKKIVAPVSDGFGDLDEGTGDAHYETADADNEWERLADKYEDLEKKVEEYLGSEQTPGPRNPPIVAAPPKMTKDELERHQATHTHTHLICRAANIA